MFGCDSPDSLENKFQVFCYIHPKGKYQVFRPGRGQEAASFQIRSLLKGTIVEYCVAVGSPRSCIQPWY